MGDPGAFGLASCDPREHAHLALGEDALSPGMRELAEESEPRLQLERVLDVLGSEAKNVLDVFMRADAKKTMEPASLEDGQHARAFPCEAVSQPLDLAQDAPRP